MSRSDDERIGDILWACDLARRVAQEGKEAFLSDWKNLPVAERMLHIIGEAANGLSDEAVANYPGVPWEQIRGLRNRISHEYHKIDLEIIWETLASYLPSLVRDLVAEPKRETP